MDIFGRKRIAALELDNTDLLVKLDKLTQQQTELLRVIRCMDDDIFAMSQQTSWESMRKHFANLLDSTMTRKNIESARIGSLVATELGKLA